MNFALGETIDQLRDMVYKFAQAEILPRAAGVKKRFKDCQIRALN